ncbi:hypothetical protein GM921_01870 [Pedobacter sp. LMG 31464]|uniref:Lipoprotein n=1 Tax=Pedobacter planticolens TaxID=2679964 RepID=A0A923DW90_9SPHI|nr:hypothetical protein [Pedobacter planticolens]MBB2144220.1 hypothetical protein [Pedobacter planticolens]
MYPPKYLPILVFCLLISCKNTNKTTKSSMISKSKNEFISNLKTNCSCEVDSIKNENTTTCDTTILENKSKLYYQFNCDSIWLTLENKLGEKKIIYSEKENFDNFFQIQWRLKYVLKKEYRKYLLFRSSCPANGPCNFVLIDKSTGKVKKEFGELIYDHDKKLFYDFVLYFSKTHNEIIVNFIDSDRQIKTDINKQDFNSSVPEYQFNKIYYYNDTITLIYNDNKKIIIDTKKYIH